MKIAIVASGTRGDVQPYVALGKGLQTAGYTVSVLTSDDFAALVNSAGLDFCSIGTSIEEMLQSPQWRRTTEGGNFLAILSRMRAELERRAHEVVLHLPALLEETDLILTGVGGLGGTFSIAAHLGIPLIQAYVFPLTPTRAFASPLAPSLPLGGRFNQLSFHLLQQMLWQSTRVADVITRRQLAMPPASLWGPFQSLKQKRIPVLYGYSRYVLPRPDDWDDLTHVTGYWFLDAPAAWVPPAELDEFLRAGDPPVYIGFGSMGSRNPAEATQLALKALSLAGQRGVLASGWGGLSQADLPETVHMISSVLHSWLFPQMAAVVHHGGAGTTAAGLRSGVPSIVVPFMGDQPFWGRRVAALGVGPAPIARRQLTAERLAQAIRQAVSDRGMRQRAAVLGQSIDAEDGVAQAVSLVQQLAPVR
jgi:sterol 3beta-glucosyltransferase